MIYFVLILLSHGLMLLNGGLFNEDWTVYNLSVQEKMEYSLQIGNWFNGLIFVLLGQHPLLCRFVAFGCILLSAWLFYKIVHRYLPREAKLIALIFAIYPVFFASIQMSLLPRIICQTLFLVAFYLTQNEKKLRLALVLFLISFQTPTLIPLYLIVLFLLWKKDYWIYFAFLPLANFFIKQVFFLGLVVYVLGVLPYCAYALANFTLQNMMNCYDFQRDWVRKLAFREIYKEEFKNTDTIFLKDETGDDGIMLLKEPYRFYEWIGVVNWMHNDDERRFVFTERMTDGNIDQALKYPDLFNVSHWWGGEEKTAVFKLKKPLTPYSVYSMLLRRNYEEYFMR